MTLCHVCGIPLDAGFFDESSIQGAPSLGEEVVLARYELHRNYCGLLVYFAQFTDRAAAHPEEVHTPGYQWEIRINGAPRDPYLAFDRIVNPWGLHGFPMNVRLDEGAVVEFVVRALAGSAQVSTNRLLSKRRPPKRTELPIAKVGGRIVGRYWYNTMYGGAPNQL